jgi:hypothetical protein
MDSLNYMQMFKSLLEINEIFCRNLKEALEKINWYEWRLLKNNINQWWRKKLDHWPKLPYIRSSFSTSGYFKLNFNLIVTFIGIKLMLNLSLHLVQPFSLFFGQCNVAKSLMLLDAYWKFEKKSPIFLNQKIVLNR